MEVRYVNFIRELTHKQVETIEMNGTMKDLLNHLCSEFGIMFYKKVYNHGKLSDEVNIFLNGQILPRSSSLKLKIASEDRICISASGNWTDTNHLINNKILTPKL
ncbi:ThiS family protein [Dethiosulfatibacter aminovorans DSM 17477]|uniref:ThiS family protein n=1 Tax=Dethiosulfatibacter aminovorans DSM 17477 TaxID=1121476 RepID=A0A1M6FRV5_9FIRM|nr:MoaD/ThiS family protein [Dethiosulfatibacter aminovorans]SHJ00416.1 ThiS family protein [Dethiosulfatibacter aminovorans DSM 17477]